MGQKFCQRHHFNTVFDTDDIDEKVICAKFPHYLTAYTAGRKRTGNLSILAAADCDCLEIPVAVINSFKKRNALCTNGGGERGILNVASLI